MATLHPWLQGMVCAYLAVAVLVPLLTPDWFGLCYRVQGNAIRLRLFHLLPVYRIRIRDTASVAMPGMGLLPRNLLTILVARDWTRRYLHIRFKRGFIRDVSITPFRAGRLVAEVRRQVG